MSIVKRILVITSLICVVFCSFIISGSAASVYNYNPNNTESVSFGRSYAIIWDLVEKRYTFRDILTEEPLGNPGLWFDEEDYFRDPVLSGNSITIDLWSTELGVFITIPISQWSIDESFYVNCTISKYDVPGDWEGSYIFTFTCFADTYVDYLEYKYDYNTIGFVFDDEDALIPSLPEFLYADVVTDPFSSSYYEGVASFSEELQNQYDLGYLQGQLNPVLDNNLVYNEGYNAGFNAGNRNVIEKNVVAGFLQGTWFGISQFVDIFLGESTIFGVSLLTVLSSLLLVIVVVAIIKKVF